MLAVGVIYVSAARLVAVIAVSTQQNFGHVPHSITLFFATSCQLQIVQTSYRTAVDADKMGMVSFITRVSIGSFETPNVISQLGSP
jgi:hypothetical protein